MADSYILFRQGKTPIGPFITIEAATDYIANKKLLGFAVFPMSRPEMEGTTVKRKKASDQNVVGSGKPSEPLLSATYSTDTIRNFVELMDRSREAFDYNTQYSLVKNCQRLLDHIVSDCPEASNMKIQLIKQVRWWAAAHGYEVSLRDAKNIVDDHLGKW